VAIQVISKTYYPVLSTLKLAGNFTRKWPPGMKPGSVFFSTATAHQRRAG
jgi:hypothetical protein